MQIPIDVLQKSPSRVLPGLLMFSVLLLGGCITTTEGGFTEKPSPEKALEQRVSLARQYIGEGSWDDAKRNLRLAQEIDANNAEVHEAFALVYQRTGEIELADESFRKAIRHDASCSRCRNNYAAFLYSQGRYEEAEVELEKVVADVLYTGRTRAFVNLGLCRRQLGKTDAAEEAFSRVLTMERTNQIALLELAQIRFEADDYAQANRHYDNYILIARQQTARGLWLGVRLAQHNGDVNAAASYGLSLRNRFPKSPEFQAYRQSSLND